MDGQSAWHIAAQEGNRNVLETLWGWTSELQRNVKDDVLLVKDKDGETALQIAFQCCVHILEKLQGWAREVHQHHG